MKVRPTGFRNGNGGRAGIQTPDLLRVKSFHPFQPLCEFRPFRPVFNLFGNLLRSQTQLFEKEREGVMEQF